jgi:hypothetical protein
VSSDRRGVNEIHYRSAGRGVGEVYARRDADCGGRLHAGEAAPPVFQRDSLRFEAQCEGLLTGIDPIDEGT